MPAKRKLASTGQTGTQSGPFSLALFAGFGLLVLVLLGYFLNLTYHQTERAIEVASLNEAKILSTHFDSTLRRIEASSNHVAAHLVSELAGIEKAAEAGVQTKQALGSLAEQFPEIVGVFVLNAAGDVVYNSDQKSGISDFLDRSLFQKIRSSPSSGLHFTEALHSKITGRSAAVAYQAILGEEGKFLGVVGTAIDLDYVARMFADIQVGERGMVSIRRSDDSRLLVRWPAVPSEINQAAKQTPPFLRISEGQSEGVIRYIGKSDGIDRIFAFHKINAYPFYVLVGRSVDVQFASWLYMTVISCALSSGALLLFWLMLRRLFRSEAQQREASLFLANTQAIAHVGGWKANPETDMLVWTEEVYRLVEHPLDQPPKGLADGLTYYAPEYLPIIQEKLAATWTGGKPFTMETEMIARSGRRFWAELRCTGRVEEAAGSFITGTFQDISERKASELELNAHRDHLEKLVAQRTEELAASESNARRILASSADGLYGIDNQGRVTFVNPAACRMLGYEQHQMLGQAIHPLIHHSHVDGSPYPESDCASHQALATGVGVRIDNEVYWHADGHPIPVMYAAHPILEDGEVTGAVVSFIDVSIQRAAEDAKTRALLAAENLARVRSEFLANMSHEIRTPLNGVIGFADIGYRNVQDTEKAGNAFEKIRQSGQLLLGVINDVLDFSKIEAGKLTIESVEMSLSQVVGNAIDIVSERAQGKSLALQVDVSPDLPERISSDPTRVKQILVNLLSNAIKFTDTGRIILSVSLKEKDLYFSVQDTGIGMDAEQLSRIFLPFEQGDGSTTRKFGGTGLGLTIVKRIVELMGGSISVRSEQDRGSTFEVRLPFVPALSGNAIEIDSQAKGVEASPLNGIRVLVVEDNEINQEILVHNLLEEGASVVATSNGKEALQRIRDEGGDAFGIILMDIQMPEMNGHEATREILGIAPDLPIIGQTAHAFAEEIQACYESGMVGYIGKPIDIDKLIELILTYAKTRSGN